MSWLVLFEPPAQAEIADAFAWYEERSYGLGGDFLRVISAAAEQLARNPEAPLHVGAFVVSCYAVFPTHSTTNC